MVNFNSFNVQDLGQGRSVGGETVSAQGHLCVKARYTQSRKEFTAEGLESRAQAPGLGWTSWEPALLVLHLPCYLCFPYRDTNWLKTVTKRGSTDMSYVDRDFMGSQIGQDNGECKTFYVSSWFFRDVWLCAILRTRTVKEDVLAWIGTEYQCPTELISGQDRVSRRTSHHLCWVYWNANSC